MKGLIGLTALAVIFGCGSVQAQYSDGTIKIQGEWEEEEVGHKKQLVITSIPYGVDKGKPLLVPAPNQ